MFSEGRTLRVPARHLGACCLILFEFVFGVGVRADVERIAAERVLRSLHSCLRGLT